MVGTLVVTLPASFKGGALVVEHQGEKVVDRGSRRQLSFVAFYADCRHEVQPVEEGYRLALTYNLILEGGKTAIAAAAAEPATVDALVRCLRDHFAAPRPSRSYRDEGQPAQPPNRLVYLLDHEYTAHGLAWQRLKGNDGARAAALRAAAERCGCELVLALAEIHETWDCMEPGWDKPWRGRNRHWERDEADDFRDEVVAALCTAENEPLLPCLVQVVLTAAKEKAKPGRSGAPALAALTRHWIGGLEARPARSAGDWSIALPDGCRCELCSKLGTFLADPVRQRLEWPLAEQGRGHIHRRIDASEIPVRHETRRSGRPYTLILSKTGELFEREARECRSWQKGTWGSRPRLYNAAPSGLAMRGCAAAARAPNGSSPEGQEQPLVRQSSPCVQPRRGDIVKPGA